jgi:hypothetical protein
MKKPYMAYFQRENKWNTVFSFGQISPLKKCVWVILTSFFYIRERERERERESEFTQGNGCNLAFLSLMGIILSFWSESSNRGNRG